MTTRYTIFKDGNNGGRETIAVKGISEETLANVLTYGVFTEDGVQVFLKEKEKPNGLRGERMIFNNECIDPCLICVHRLRKVSGECRSCTFEAKKDIEWQTPDYKPLLTLLKEQQAEKVSPKLAMMTYLPFEPMIDEDDISLDDETIQENKEKFAEQAQKAVQTKKFKKEHCATCVYSDEKNNCNHSHPSYCRLRYYNDEKTMMEKTLTTIQDRDALLSLSRLCGYTVRYHRVRYRVSYVKNENTKQFVLKRDYHPWNEITVSLDELVAIEPSWKGIIEYQKPLDEASEEEKDKHAVTIALIRKNWEHISRINSWQNQQMFWASWNPHRNAVDIAIHLSKNYYEYQFKSPLELVKKTIFVGI